MASMPVRAGEPADSPTGPLPLPAPFRWDGEHIACELPGGRVLFTTRRGGCSKPPYDTLNLGLLTDDDPVAVDANRDRLATLTGIPRARTLQGLQVHEAFMCGASASCPTRARRSTTPTGRRLRSRASRPSS